MYLNKVMIIGNLTRDPELKSLPSGVKVTSIGLATNRSWKKEDGSKQESTEFHNAVAFGKPAELIAQYCRKGSSIYVDGRLQTRSWDGTDGQKKYRTEIVVENFQFGPRASEGTGTYSKPNEKGSSNSAQKDQPEAIEYPTEDINAEDIPF
jgi:single-strand DNA-binding protein